MNNSEHIVIIGSSAAGISAAKEIRKITERVSISIISSDENMPYYRPFLSEYIGDEKIELKSTFYLNKDAWYEENNIALILGETVTEIDSTNKFVKTDKLRSFTYTKLIIATGSTPFIPFKDIIGYENVATIRSFDDTKKIVNYAKKIDDVTIIGGGLLGIEAAENFKKIGKSVRIIELSEYLLSKQLDKKTSILLKDSLEKNGIELKLKSSIEKFIPDGENRIKEIKLNSGEIISTGMIIVSIGVRSNKKIVENIGIDTNRGIIVNEKMQTSLKDIFACGDVCEFKNVPALWMPAIKQGKVAGLNAIGVDLEFEVLPYPAILNTFGLRIYSVGKIPNESEIKNFVVVSKEDLKKCQKLFFEENVLVGAIFIGDMKNSMKALTGIANKLKLSQVENLLQR